MPRFPPYFFAGLGLLPLKSRRYTVHPGAGSIPRRSDLLDTTHPYELFNAALDAFGRADLPRTVVLLRGGFFANLYIAPTLLGEEYHPQRIWHASADGEPLAAREYSARYGRLWQSRPDALLLLREVWRDPLVRAELRGFINLSRNLLASREADVEDRLRERDTFMSPARLERTQSEILSRLSKSNLRLPPPKPRMALLMLASRDTAASERFYRELLGIEPVRTSQVGGGYAEFEAHGVSFAIHGLHSAASSDPFHLGPPPASLGWGAIFVFRVADIERHYRSALELSAPIVDCELTVKGRRHFVTKDPSGYLIEITEEEPAGLEGVAP